MAATTLGHAWDAARFLESKSCDEGQICWMQAMGPSSSMGAAGARDSCPDGNAAVNCWALSRPPGIGGGWGMPGMPPMPHGGPWRADLRSRSA